MIFNKKKTYEQHDNEKGSFYQSTVNPYNSNDILQDYLETL